MIDGVSVFQFSNAFLSLSLCVSCAVDIRAHMSFYFPFPSRFPVLVDGAHTQKKRARYFRLSFRLSFCPTLFLGLTTFTVIRNNLRMGCILYKFNSPTSAGVNERANAQMSIAEHASEVSSAEQAREARRSERASGGPLLTSRFQVVLHRSARGALSRSPKNRKCVRLI